MAKDLFVKKKKAFELFLGAGSGCNMQCKYCFAGHQDCSQTQAKAEINEDLLLQKLGNNDINIDGKVVIWGGEPLLNKAALELAVEFVRKNWESIDIQVVTNGLALNSFWVKFINDKRITITISHDGVGQKYRGYDFLQNDKYLKLLRQVEQFNSFHYVLHRYNNDVKAIDTYFQRVENRLGKSFGVTGGPMRHTNPYTLDFIPRKEDGSLQKVCESALYILSEGLAGNNLKYHKWLLQKLPKYLRFALYGEREYTSPFCGATDVVCIGLNGREFLCHAEAERLANDLDAVTTTSGNFRFSKLCLECDTFQLCGGVCAAIPDDEYREANCEFYKAWNSTIYLYVLDGMKSLGEEKLQEIVRGLEANKNE